MSRGHAVVAAVLLVGALAAPADAQCGDAPLVEPVTNSDPYFGVDVALRDGVAIVGSANALFGSSPSWAFELQPGGWSSGSPLPPDALVTHYGDSVDVWGDTAVVAGQDLDDPGVAAYVFERAGGAWTPSAKLLSPSMAASVSPGLHVAIEADTILVADRNMLSAYVFERASGVWSLAQTLAPGGAVGSVVFGTSASLRGGRAIVGGCAPGAGSCHGTAWVFERQGGVFVPTARLVTSGGEDDDFAGIAVAQSDDTIVLGAPGHGLGFPSTSIGAAFVFELDAGTWSQTAFVTAPAPLFGDFFGAAVALQDDLLVVGAPQRDGVVPAAGAAFVYRRSGPAWQPVATLLASEPLAYGNFGGALALDGETLLVGAQAGSVLDQDQVHILYGVAGLVDWTSLAAGVAGSTGTPCTFGSGTPAVGAAASVTLTGAAPLAPAWLVLGIDRIFAPFKGGVLVPAPQLLLPQLTDGAGGTTLHWTWPPGLPPGLVLALQHWIVDAGAPVGLSGGNALLIDVP